MGLRARIDLHEWGFPDETPILSLPIEYSGVGELFGTMAQEMAAGVCPVDTGYLQSSIHGSGGDTDGEIEASAEYAQYVEYGTWKMAAQPYFTSAVEQGAAMAFSVAMQIYQQALAEEQAILSAQEAMANMMNMASMMGGGDFVLPPGPNEGGLWGGAQLTVGGVRFNQDGLVASGLNYFMTQPSIWGTNTAMYKVAMERSAHLSEYRAEAMRRFAHDRAIRSSMLHTGSHMSMSSTRGSGAVNFGYSVGMFAMGSIMGAGGGWLGGLLGGMLVGGLATLIGLVLGDAFGGGGPEFSMPEIEIT